eukprot:RCo009961
MAEFRTKVVCIGAGFVGGPAMAVLAQQCPDIKVTVMETDFLSPARIQEWNSEKLPFFEPDLEGIVRQVRGKNLFFTQSSPEALEEADIVFISVHTPTKKHGMGAGMAPDLDLIEHCARFLSQIVTSGWKIVVEMSTVPVRCAEAIHKVLAAAGNPQVRYDVLSNPSFRSQACAVQQLLSPD